VTRSALFTALLAAFGIGCGGERSEAPQTFDRIILVTIDTLRADHLGSYGYPFETSPFLDSLAERSVVFERAYAAMSMTLPSHASMFTSLYPIQHRVLKNSLKLGDPHWTLAEILSDAGFATGGFASMRAHFAQGGLAQGFATFDEPPPAGKDEPPYRSATETVGRAIQWTEQFSVDDRFFLWVHLYDPHQPLFPPEAHRESVAADGESAQRERIRFLREQQHISRGVGHDGQPVFRKGDTGMLELHSAYDGEIHYVDSEISRLFAALERTGLGASALWVFTSDHGEGLGNHAYKFHGRNIYEEQVRVPLIFHAADSEWSPRRIDAPVEHVDIGPTLCELAGLEGALRTREPRLQGRSLVPYLSGQHANVAGERPAFVQRREYASGDRDSALVRRDFEKGRKFALIERRWKLIHRSSGADELYDLEEDPYELHDQAFLHPDRVAEMKARLLARIAALRKTAGPDAESVDESTIERLRALGYAP
jgi:arylsulfatase